MSSPESRIFGRLFEHASWYESKGVLHIGHTTGKPGHWIVHPLCQKRLRGWIGFCELSCAKTDVICEVCAMLFVAQKIIKRQTIGDKEE